MKFPGPGNYILVGQTPVRCDNILEWGEWYRHADRHVFATRVGDYWVSTIFLGLDHNWGGGPPILFETMIFPYFESVFDLLDERRQQEITERGLDQDLLDSQWRWHDWLDAEAGHERVVGDVELATGAKRWDDPQVEILTAVRAAVNRLNEEK